MNDIDKIILKSYDTLLGLLQDIRRMREKNNSVFGTGFGFGVYGMESGIWQSGFERKF